MAAARDHLTCPKCGGEVIRYRNPFPTVDIIIEIKSGNEPGPVILIQRANEPKGWALPGGFVDYGESVETAARREAVEETGLEVELLALLGVYSQPGRDPRFHTQTTVFAATAQGTPKAGSDAAGLKAFSLDSLPQTICFDHGLILEDYRKWRAGERPAAPIQEET
jgi:ADP-ribose pyrophosphatase YjhB (NUDIX family)